MSKLGSAFRLHVRDSGTEFRHSEGGLERINSETVRRQPTAQSKQCGE